MSFLTGGFLDRLFLLSGLILLNLRDFLKPSGLSWIVLHCFLLTSYPNSAVKLKFRFTVRSSVPS